MTRFHHPVGKRRRGISSIYLAFITVMLVAFMAVSFDFGRARYGRGQLQTASDAAARAGAYGVPFNQAVANAVAYAAKNQCLLTPVQLLGSQDVQVGIWDVNKRTFTVLQSTGGKNDPIMTGNAVQATAVRTAARGDPVNHVIPIYGMNTSDITTTATALVRGTKISGFAVVGLLSIKMNGNDTVAASNQSVDAASLGSNGDINLVGNVLINGDARAAGTLNLTGGATVTGWRGTLDPTISDPVVSAPTNITANSNDNSQLPSGSIDANGNFVGILLPGGTSGSPTRYYFNNFSPKSAVTIGGNTNIVVAGSFSMTSNITIQDSSTGSLPSSPVNFYIAGPVELGGGVSIASNLASDFNIYVTTSSKVTLDGNTAVYGHIYAPLSAITIKGTPDIYGWVVGNTVDFKGNTNVHYDGTNNTNANGLTIVLVQ